MLHLALHSEQSLHDSSLELKGLGLLARLDCGADHAVTRPGVAGEYVVTGVLGGALLRDYARLAEAHDLLTSDTFRRDEERRGRVALTNLDGHDKAVGSVGRQLEPFSTLRW